MSLYMHTIDGEPAVFTDERFPRIHFAGKTVTGLATSLKEIREQQRRVQRADAKDGVGPFKYGYVRITTRAVAHALAWQARNGSESRISNQGEER